MSGWSPEAYFCGVLVGGSGHHCRSWPPVPDVWPRLVEDPTPWAGGGVPLCDWHPARDGLRAPGRTFLQRPTCIETEGIFAHLMVDGWTMLAAWDRSGDKRGGGTATFALRGELLPVEALDRCRGLYPALFQRIECYLGRVVSVQAFT